MAFLSFLFKSSLVLFTLLKLIYSQDYPDPGTVTGDTAGVADPGIVRAPDGTYILFSTGVGIPIRTSTDRINWVAAGTVFPDGAPEGTYDYTGGAEADANLWAPDVTYVDDKYILYYAASTFGSNLSGIFMAQSTTGLTGSWTDEGLVVSTDTDDDWNAIDPHLVISGSDWYLSAGSFWDGIYLIPLDSDTGKPSGAAYIHLAERASPDAQEASFIYNNGSYWYLFTSWDTCCDGIDSTYNIRVVRSTSVTGAYEDESGVEALDSGGTEILGTHGTIYGPGGQSLLFDVDGVVIFYHYYTETTTELGINLLNFDSGWPVVY